MAKATGRSPVACGHRGEALGLPDPNAGLLSFRALARRLGVNPARLANLARAAGVTTVARLPATKYARVAAGARGRALTPGAAVKLARLVRESTGRVTTSPMGSWGCGDKPEGCMRCLSTRRPHKSRELCDRCEAAARRLGVARPVDYPRRLAPLPDAAGAAGRDVLATLAACTVPVGARAIAARCGRFREQVTVALAALERAGIVARARGLDGRLRAYRLAYDVGRWWWAPEAKRRAALWQRRWWNCVVPTTTPAG